LENKTLIHKVLTFSTPQRSSSGPIKASKTSVPSAICTTHQLIPCFFGKKFIKQ